MLFLRLYLSFIYHTRRASYGTSYISYTSFDVLRFHTSHSLLFKLNEYLMNVFIHRCYYYYYFARLFFPFAFFFSTIYGDGCPWHPMFIFSAYCNKSLTHTQIYSCLNTNYPTHAGLYGNDDLHNGLMDVLTAGRKVDHIISSVRNQSQILESTLSNKIRPQLVELADIFDQPASNQTALSQLILSLNIVQGNVTTAKNAATDIRRPLIHVTITSFLSVRIFYQGMDSWTLISFFAFFHGNRDSISLSLFAGSAP